MINTEIYKIMDYLEHGFMNRACLEKYVKKCTEPFTYNKDNYTNMISYTEATTASILSIYAVGNVLQDKQKGNELSPLEARRRKLTGRKKKRGF